MSLARQGNCRDCGVFLNNAKRGNGRCRKCDPVMGRRVNGSYRTELESLYSDAPPTEDCSRCGRPLEGDSTIEHVPSMGLVKRRGAFGLMLRTRSHAACNTGLIEA